MDAILRGLGYAPRLCYEKFRCEWDLPQGLLFLDILPFGHFLEIESSPEAIVPIARGLDLDPRTALDKSYHSLHQSWRRLNGLDASEDFVFDEGERQRLTISLGLSARPAGENNAQ
jgi:adenylate cyclase class 2